MPGTAIHDIGAAAAAVAIDSALNPGDQIRIANVGDDSIYWIVAADTPPAGQPGFPLARGKAHILGVPKTGVALYAWAAGASRLALDALSGFYGTSKSVAPGATAVLSVGPTPAVLSDPAGTWPLGTRLIVYNAGAATLQSRASLHPGATPEPDPSITVPGGGFMELVTGDGDSPVWAWCGWPGTTVLSTAAGKGWEIA